MSAIPSRYGSPFAMTPKYFLNLHARIKIEYKIYKSRRKAIKLLVFSTLFVGAGLFILAAGKANPMMAWATIIFFGLGIPISLFQLLDRRPQIIVNEIRIFDRIAHKDFINWELIEDAYFVKVEQETFICLVVPEAFEPSNQQSNFKRKMAGLSKAVGFQDLNISLGNVDVDAERMIAFILAMRSADHGRRQSLIKNRLAASI